MFHIKNNTYTEIEFLNALCEKTNYGILLDVNNIYVSTKTIILMLLLS